MSTLPPTLVALFAAEQRRDWEAMRGLLAEDVEWRVIPSGADGVRGRDAYVRRLRSAYEDGDASGFTVRRVLRGAAGLVVTELVDEQGRVSVDVFEVRDGVVAREWEYLLGLPPEP